VQICGQCIVVGSSAAVLAFGSLINAPLGSADCTDAGGTTVCAQGEVRGSSGGGTSSGPYYPYPCEYDWLCRDGGVSIALDTDIGDGPSNPPPDLGRPGRPDIGQPGTPGNRPGVSPGGGGRGGGGGGAAGGGGSRGGR